MKSFLSVLSVILLVSTAAAAGAQQAPQPAAPSNDEMIAAYYAETGQLRAMFGAAQRDIIALKKQLDECRAAKPAGK